MFVQYNFSTRKKAYRKSVGVLTKEERESKSLYASCEVLIPEQEERMQPAFYGDR